MKKQQKKRYHINNFRILSVATLVMILYHSFLYSETFVTLAVGAPVELELISVQQIWEEAPHNAFPDMVRFNNQWYLAFREADSHDVSSDGNVQVIRSTDGVTWEPVVEFDRIGEDLRDARLTVLDDSRLMLNSAAAPLDSVYSRQSLCWFSENGTDWSDAYEVGEEDWWLWSVAQHPDGDLYGVAYGRLGENPTPTTTTRLYNSSDGMNYVTVVPTLTSEGSTNEADIVFCQDGTAVTLVRGSSGRCYVGTSNGDYTNWTFKTIYSKIGGPELIELPDGNILAASRLTDGIGRTSISWLDPDDGIMEELLTLPSGGDCGYPGMVWHNDRLWITYYSSHGDGKARIYFAEVAVSEGEAESAALVCRHMNDKPPATENWTLLGDGLNVSESAVKLDSVGGLAAWNISDDGTNTGSIRYYSKTPTTLQMERAADEGWVLSARLRVVDVADDMDASIFAEYASNLDELNRRFAMAFGSSEDGDPIVSLYTDQTICLEGLGGGYHLYELRYDPISGTADLFVDGMEYLSDYSGFANSSSLSRIIWGANQSASKGNANYNMIYFRNSLADPIVGDANCDGKVDNDDAQVLAENWLATSAVWEMGDFNNDGIINDLDATLLAANWGKEHPILTNVAPEPSTAVFLLALIAAMILQFFFFRFKHADY